MGKVFVKGPVESPDDLLAKESQAARIGRVGLDATQGAVNLTRPQSIQSFADLAGVPLNIARYFMEGRHKRKLNPQEEAIQNARLRQIAQDQIREEMQPAMDAKAALAAKEKEEADNQALLSRFQNLSQRKGAEAAQLSGHKGATDLADYEEYARQNYPGMSLNEVANMLGQQFTNVEGLDLRRRMTGKEGIEGFGPAQQTAQGLQTASNAAEPTMVGASGTQGDTMPPEIRRQRNRNTANQKIAEMAQEPNVAAIAAHPETTSPPEGGESAENTNDAAMEAKVNEQGLNDNSESTQEALQQQGGEKETPDLDAAERGNAREISAIDFNAGAPQLPTDVPPTQGRQPEESDWRENAY